jgi:protein-tyrosine phosphatase
VTDVVKVDQQSSYWEVISRAAQVIRRGGLVAFPTETVYGLGVRADIPGAIRRLRAAKQRDEGKPFTVHIGRRRDVERFVPDMPPVARRFTRKAWPGPLTLLLEVNDPNRAPVVAELGQEVAHELYQNGLVGLRCPDDQVAADLLNEAGPPVVASSANVAGARPPRTADEVLEQMADSIDLLIDGGPTRYAKASTIVRVYSPPAASEAAAHPAGAGESSGAAFTVIREGVYDDRALRRLATVNILFVCTGNTCRSPMAVGLCRRLLADRLACSPHDLERLGYSITSAGLAAHYGSGAAPEAAAVMKERGIDISDHTTQPLTHDLARQADRVFTMTHSQLEWVLDLAPEAAERVQMLAAEMDIEDPVGAGPEVYAACAERIETALRQRLAEIEL